MSARNEHEATMLLTDDESRVWEHRSRMWDAVIDTVRADQGRASLEIDPDRMYRPADELDDEYGRYSAERWDD